MVLHQLDDHPNVVRVVLDGDDAHDVRRIFCVRVLAVLVCQHQTGVRVVHLHAVQVDGVHHRALEELHRREVPFDEALQLKVGWLPVEKNHLHVHVLSVLVEEVLQKVGHTLVGDVAADDDMPEVELFW